MVPPNHGRARRRCVQRELLRQLAHFGLHARDGRVVLFREHGVDRLRYLEHFGLGETARGHGRGADADPARDERLLGVAGNRVLVHCDAGPVEQLLGLLASHLLGPQIHEHQVGVRPARHDGVAQLDERRGEGLRVAHVLNSGVSASARATAFAAMTCSSGPPWRPGNTCLSTSLPNTSWQRIKPPRGPRRVLWVVVVTICACGTGEGWIPAATSPATCAMSTMKIAPTSSAILRSVANSMMRA